MDELDILLSRSYNSGGSSRKQSVSSEEEVVDKLTRLLSSSRLAHSLGVRDACDDLARRFGVDRSKARLAGLCHDCAKSLDEQQLCDAARGYGISVDRWRTESLALLHGPVGAFLAKDLFGVDDVEILHAIAVHTTGCVDMSMLDLVLFVADYIEPNRTFPGVDEIRQLAERSLELAALRGYVATITHLLKTDRVIHPYGIEARNGLLTRISKSTTHGPVRSDEIGGRG